MAEACSENNFSVVETATQVKLPSRLDFQERLNFATEVARIIDQGTLPEHARIFCFAPDRYVTCENSVSQELFPYAAYRRFQTETYSGTGEIFACDHSHQCQEKQEEQPQPVQLLATQTRLPSRPHLWAV